MRSVGLLLLVLLLAALARAQPVTVLAPPDRFVAPGEFVTLVFRVEAPEQLEVRVEASVSAAWVVLRQPGEMVLEAGRSTPVAVTVEVPSDALAYGVELVTLSVGVGAQLVERSVELTVTERASLSLEAPRELTLGPEGLEVRVANDGNTPERASLELQRGATVLARRELELAPGERVTVGFDLRDDGTHTLVLTGERTGEVRRSVGVLRFGAPEPEPFTLAGELAGGLTSSGAWSGSVGLQGPLSDRGSLETRVDAAAPRRSFAEVTVGHASLRVGGAWRDPLQLRMPSGLGVAAAYRAPSVALAATYGAVDAGAVGGFGAEWRGTDVRLAAGAGWSVDAPWYAARASSVDAGAGTPQWSVAAAYLRSALTVDLGVEIRSDETTTTIQLEGRELLGDAARIAASLRLRNQHATRYLDVRVPLAADEPWLGRLGTDQRLVSALPGELRVAVQLGTRENFARISHQASLGGAWRSLAGLGVRADTIGAGLTVDGALSYLGAATFGVDARLAYYPTRAAFGGRVAVRYQLDGDGLNLSLGSTWNLSEQSAGASATIDWRDGPWRVDLSGGVGYAYGSPATAWSANLALSTRYAFDLPVSEAIVAVAGGRDLGTIRGRVLADGEPIEGVEFSVGRYRVRSDERGVFTLDLRPGSYQVAMDLASLPLAFQLLDEPRRTVEVRRRATTEVTITAARTTVLRGRVLEDRDGDGRADEPAVGVRARLLVVDAAGLRRSVVTDDDGAFVLRGLLPGEVSVALTDVPRGATVIGDAERTLAVAVDAPGEVVYLVQPAVVTVQAFTPQAFRVRGVALEVDRAPPGAAPLVRVDVQGDPEAVTLVTADGVEEALAWDGDAWIGRVPVSQAHAAGPLGFTVIAREGEAEVTRRAQVIADLAAPLMELASDAPVRPGERLTVQASVFLAARSVTLAQPFDDEVALVEDAPGRWSGSVLVPEGTPDSVYELAVRAEALDGRTFVETLRFRVLAP